MLYLCFIYLFMCVHDVKSVQGNLFELSIIHLNDFHARFEETTPLTATPCKENATDCIGGFARIYTVVNQLQAERPNPVFLNAGDNFQGTLWYNIHRWNVTQYFLNKLKTDAIALGNHEFDHKIEGCVPFLKSMKAPFVLANVNDDDETSFQGLYKKSIVIERSGRKIGIIGVILQTTNLLAATGNLIFLDESESVKREADRLTTEEAVDIIIVLSHCGLDVDKIIAKNAGPYVDVIVGAHSHSFMYTGTELPGPDKPVANYPLVVENDGHKVLIVQASAYSKYVGNITVRFDDDGNVVNWDGAPVYLGNTVIPDKDILNELKPWADDVQLLGRRKLGYTKVPLQKDTCLKGECNLGSFITDAYVYNYINSIAEKDEWTRSTIAIINAGGMRTPLEKGSITYNDLMTSQPFENTIDTLDLQGEHIWNMLEFAAIDPYGGEKFNGANLLQVSGLRIVLNITEPAGSRLKSVEVLCTKCAVPKYEPLVHSQWYNIIVPSFIAGGGDNFKIISENKQNHVIGNIDSEAVENYIAREHPIAQGPDGRIKIIM